MSSSVTGGKFQVNNAFNTFFSASNDTQGAVLQLEKTRSTSPGSYTIVQDGDTLGELQFKGSNGSASVIGANIQAIVNGTPGSGNDLPTDLIFRTMPDGSGSTIKRMRIQEDGKVVIGSGTPDYQTGNMTSGAVGINVTGTSPQVLLHNTNDDKDAYLGIVGSNLFLFSADSIPIIFGNGDSEKMRLDTTGRLLINTSSSINSDGFETHLQVAGTNSQKSSAYLARFSDNASAPFLILAKSRNGTVGGNTAVQAGDDLGVILFHGNDGSGFHEAARISAVCESGVGNDDLPSSITFKTNSGTTNVTEKMRIDSSGTVYIGTTTAGNTGSYFLADNNDRTTLNVASSSTATQNQIIFRNPNDRVGTIQTSGTSTSYNTTFSDIASKKNFENWTEDVLSLFKNINPQKFNFKVEDDTASKSKGFIAQEMVDKFPEAYVKQEDEMYMFNPSGMAVYLMKALQESVVKIEALETKVAALEAA